MRRLTLAAAVTLTLVLDPPAHALSWTRPVGGEVTRGFGMHGSPYARGQHRGADFAAAPRTTVRAPCGGRVAVAGPIGNSGGVVTVTCGPWRASVLPLARIDVHVGAHVAAGEPVGAAGTGRIHAGIHLGVRRAGRRFGYVDPLRFLGRPGPRPFAPIGPRPRTRDRRPPATAPTHLVAPGHSAPAGHPALLPWPAWVGAALLLAGASGEVFRRRARRLRAGGAGALARARTRTSPVGGE